MVKIRLQRAGAKKRPFYRVVALDSRRQRDGRALEFLGTYDPTGEPARIRLDLARIEAWQQRGAQVSETVSSLIARARRQAAAASAPGEAS